MELRSLILPTAHFLDTSVISTLRQGSSSAFCKNFAPMASWASPRPTDSHPVGANFVFNDRKMRLNIDNGNKKGADDGKSSAPKPAQNTLCVARLKVHVAQFKHSRCTSEL